MESRSELSASVDDGIHGRQDAAAEANVLYCVAVIGFTVAAWAVFKEYSWWETPALLFGVVGLMRWSRSTSGSVSSMPFGHLAVQINLWMHILGSGAVIAIVLLPAGHDWVTALRRR